MKAAGAKMKLVQIAEEIVALLASDPNAEVKVIVEIMADFPQGVDDGLKRSVTENAGSLGFKYQDWEWRKGGTIHIALATCSAVQSTNPFTMKE